MAWFRRNKFRLHPSHDFVAGPSRSRGHGRPRHPNLPYRHFRAYTIALRYHFSDINNSYSFDYQKNSYVFIPLQCHLVSLFFCLESPAERKEDLPVGSSDQDFRDRFCDAAVFIEDVVAVRHVILIVVYVLSYCKVSEERTF